MNKNIGTVSNDEGLFELEIPNEFIKDTLTFSIIGYETKSIAIRKLLLKKSYTISLSPKAYMIEEAQISSTRLKQKTVGNRTHSGAVVMGLTSDTASFGREIGAVIKLPKKSVFIKDLNFNLVLIRPDSAKFRLNIYEYDRGIKSSLLNQNIYFSIRRDQEGEYTLDLSEYDVRASKDIFVSIEMVNMYISAGPDPDINPALHYHDKILFSGTVTGSKCFVRSVSHGSWEKIQVFSPGYWLTVLK